MDKAEIIRRLNMIHNACMSSCPKQAVGEMIAALLAELEAC
jgi:hypothetical protein